MVPAPSSGDGPEGKSKPSEGHKIPRRDSWGRVGGLPNIGSPPFKIGVNKYKRVVPQYQIYAPPPPVERVSITIMTAKRVQLYRIVWPLWAYHNGSAVPVPNWRLGYRGGSGGRGGLNPVNKQVRRTVRYEGGALLGLAEVIRWVKISRRLLMGDGCRPDPGRLFWGFPCGIVSL